MTLRIVFNDYATIKHTGWVVIVSYSHVPIKRLPIPPHNISQKPICAQSFNSRTAGNTFAISHQQESNLHPARHVPTHICGIEPRCPADLPIELQWPFVIPYKLPVYSCMACSWRYTRSLRNNDPQLHYFRNGAPDTPTTTPHGVCLSLMR